MGEVKVRVPTYRNRVMIFYTELSPFAVMQLVSVRWWTDNDIVVTVTITVVISI